MAARLANVLRNYKSSVPIFVDLFVTGVPRQGAGSTPQTMSPQSRDYMRIFEAELDPRERSVQPLGWWIGVHRLHWENVMTLRSVGPGLGQRDCRGGPGPL
jgi:hypothetical protein